MRVKIIRVIDNTAVDAVITLPAASLILPSVTDGWRFNFKTNTKKERLQTYVLLCEETPKTIEGCLSFKMRSKTEPYMSYIEDENVLEKIQGATMGADYNHVNTTRRWRKADQPIFKNDKR